MGYNPVLRSKGDAEKLPDGRWRVEGVDGLSLRVVGNSRRYYLRTTVNDRRVEIAIGSAADLTPKQAQHKALAIKLGAVETKLPASAEKPSWAEVAQRAEAKRLHAFSVALENFISAHAPSWKGGKTGRNGLTIRRMMELHSVPVIGDTPCELVTVDHMLAILRPIWTDRAETGERVLRYTTAVIHSNLIDRDLPSTPAIDKARIKQKLKLKHVANVGRIATATGKAQGRRGSHPSPTLKTLRAFAVWALRPDASISSLATAFLAFTAVRSHSVRAADWRQFDFEANTWTIPEEHSKSGIEHVVPLSNAALSVLKRRRAGDEWPMEGLVFPAPRGGQLSDMALSQCVRGWSTVTKTEHWVPHGLRGAFKGWSVEAGVATELAEISLGHLPSRDAVANAYTATTAVEKRRVIMANWANAIAAAGSPQGAASSKPTPSAPKLTAEQIEAILA